MTKWKYDFRDVSVGLRVIREWLLGRRHTLHGRFMPTISPRTIPPPDIPRGPEYKYANQYYTRRSAMDSVRPPVIAPVAEGPPTRIDPTKPSQVGGIKPDSMCFLVLPTPGQPWWWDGHFYYMCSDQPPCGKAAPPTTPPKETCQPSPTPAPCGSGVSSCNPCKREPTVKY